MSEERVLTIRDEVLMPTTFAGIMQQAETLVKSGLLPISVKTAQAAVAIILTGRELGIPPMQAFRSIYVVNGVPSLSAQLMGALIFRAGHSYKVDELTAERCQITLRRKSGEVYTHAVTMAEAKAGKWDQSWDKESNGWKPKFTWGAFPKPMLFSRCLSAGARVLMPDVISGIYTPDELANDLSEETPPVVIIEGEAKAEAARPVTSSDNERDALEDGLPEPEDDQPQLAEQPSTGNGNPGPWWAKDKRQMAELWAWYKNQVRLEEAGVRELLKAIYGVEHHGELSMKLTKDAHKAAVLGRVQPKPPEIQK